jgi:hypothetical protein
VPDTRSHRGADPRDAEAFAASALMGMRAAVYELSWLLDRGYAIVSALKLVGDRWSLTERQRMAVRRAACGDEARARRLERLIPVEDLAGRVVLVDGFNVVTTVETALGGGVILACRDGTFRDLAGVHGTYRRVAETMPSLVLVGETLKAAGVGAVRWLFDRPVSNSGRIARIVAETAAAHGWDWAVELVDSPDAVLKTSREVVATADSAVLDRCGPWCNLARSVIESRCPGAWVIDLGSAQPVTSPRDG